MASIYELTGDMLELQNMLDDPECEVSDECLVDTFESLEGEYSDKLNAYCRLMTINNNVVDGLSEEIKRLQSKKKALENQNKRLKKTVVTSLVGLGYNKYDTGTYKFNRFRKSLDVIGNVPDEYKKIQESKVPDKTAIKKAIEDGVPLCFARLIDDCTIS